MKYAFLLQNKFCGKIFPIEPKNADLTFLHKVQLLIDPEDKLQLKTGCFSISEENREYLPDFLAQVEDLNITNLLEHKFLFLKITTWSLEDHNSILEFENFYTKKIDPQILKNRVKEIILEDFHRKQIKIESERNFLSSKIKNSFKFVTGFGSRRRRISSADVDLDSKISIKSIFERATLQKEFAADESLKGFLFNWDSGSVQLMSTIDEYFLLETIDFELLVKDIHTNFDFSIEKAGFEKYVTALYNFSIEDYGSPLRYLILILKNSRKGRFLELDTDIRFKKTIEEIEKSKKEKENFINSASGEFYLRDIEKISDSLYERVKIVPSGKVESSQELLNFLRKFKKVSKPKFIRLRRYGDGEKMNHLRKRCEQEFFKNKKDPEMEDTYLKKRISKRIFFEDHFN